MYLWLPADRHELNMSKKDSGNIMKVNKNVYNEFMLIFFKGPREVIVFNEEYLLTNVHEAESLQAWCLVKWILIVCHGIYWNHFTVWLLNHVHVWVYVESYHIIMYIYIYYGLLLCIIFYHISKQFSQNFWFLRTFQLCDTMFSCHMIWDRDCKYEIYLPVLII